MTNRKIIGLFLYGTGALTILVMWVFSWFIVEPAYPVVCQGIVVLSILEVLFGSMLFIEKEKPIPTPIEETKPEPVFPIETLNLDFAGLDKEVESVVNRLSSGDDSMALGATTDAVELLTQINKQRNGLKLFIYVLSGAPESEASSFVRAACVAYLDEGTNKLPPGDPLTNLISLVVEKAQLTVKNDELRKELESIRELAERNYPGLKISGLCSKHHGGDVYKQRGCSACFPSYLELCRAHDELKQKAWEDIKKLEVELAQAKKDYKGQLDVASNLGVVYIERGKQIDMLTAELQKLKG